MSKTPMLARLKGSRHSDSPVSGASGPDEVLGVPSPLRDFFSKTYPENPGSDKRSRTFAGRTLMA